MKLRHIQIQTQKSFTFAGVLLLFFLSMLIWVIMIFIVEYQDFIRIVFFFKFYSDMSHVHVLLYGVKFNSEIDIVQFIFT